MRTPAAQPDDIDLITVGGAVRRSMQRVLILSAIVGALTAGVLATMAPRYTAQAQLEVISTGILNPYDPKREGQQQADVAVRMDKEAVGTHVRAMLSTDLALAMSKELDLADRPEFNTALPADDLFTRVLQVVGIAKPRAGETDTDRVLSSYYRALRVFQGRDTRGITVEMSSSDPVFAADAANRLTDLYRASLANRTITETEDARTKIGPQIERLSKEVGEADAEVTNFRGRANLFQGGAQATALSEQQLADFTGELTKAVAARGEAEARASAARDQMARGTADSNPDVQKSALIPRLSEQRVRLERQVSELAASLLPAHPRMKQLNGDLTSLNRQIKAEVQKVVESLERDARIAAEREGTIKRRLEETKRSVVSSAPDDARLRQLENVAKSKRSELERLQRQYEAAISTVATGAAPVEVKVVQRAFPLNEKTWPKITMMAPLASLAAMLLGLAWCIPRELLRAARSGGTPTPAATAVAQPAADRRDAPLLEAQTIASDRAPASAATKDARDAAGVAAAILSRPSAENGIRLMIAGQDERTLATAEAIDLVNRLAAAGRRSIIVDWTAKGRGIAETATIASKAGALQLVDGAASLEETIVPMPGSDAHAIVSGTADAATTNQLFEAERANLVLDALDEMYDVIVVHADYTSARALLGAIEGRIDLGIIVNERRPGVPSLTDPQDFLGYQLADLEVLRIERAPTKTGGPARRGGGRASILGEARA